MTLNWLAPGYLLLLGLVPLLTNPTGLANNLGTTLNTVLHSQRTPTIYNFNFGWDYEFPHEVVLALRELFVLQNTFHWIKSVTVETRAGEEISVGHFKPINSQRFVTDCHEYVFHLTKQGNVPLERLAVGVSYADKSNISRWGHTGGRDKRCRGNNWFVPYETIKSRANQRPHPATFPVQLAKWCIKIHGRNPELSVLDPFLGIGNAASC